MALSVYVVNNNTRLVMPASAWSHSVLGLLVMQGHEVRRSEEPAAFVEQDRNHEELDRRDILVQGTGY